MHYILLQLINWRFIEVERSLAKTSFVCKHGAKRKFQPEIPKSLAAMHIPDEIQLKYMSYSSIVFGIAIFWLIIIRWKNY